MGSKERHTAESWSRSLTSPSAFRNTLSGSGFAEKPSARLEASLLVGDAAGYRKRAGLPMKLSLVRGASESELREVFDAVYRQLLNRVPLEDERLISAESLLRDGQIDLEGFIEAV